MNAADAYAVVGHPIAHSRSPFIHAQFAAQTGERIVYRALDLCASQFVSGLADFRASGGRGVNVTVPHKRRAFDYASERTARAKRAGAVNTLRFERDGEALGDNTDGVGLIRDLRSNLGLELAGLAILLLGAGGAARGVLGPLLDAAPSRVQVANRTAERARALAADFAADGEVQGGGLEAAADGGYALVVNATASSLSGRRLPLTPASFGADAFAYDMMYAQEPTPFLRQAAELGASRSADGRGMLVEQAAESFFVWRGVRPRTAPVIEALGTLLASG